MSEPVLRRFEAVSSAAHKSILISNNHMKSDKFLKTDLAQFGLRLSIDALKLEELRSQVVTMLIAQALLLLL
jgi:hypothetical protein